MEGKAEITHDASQRKGKYESKVNRHKDRM